MNFMLKLRGQLQDFYTSYDVYIRPVLRFALAIICFVAINTNIGYLNVLNNIFVILILSVICAILPLNGIVLIGTLLIVAHSFGLSVETGAFAVVIYLLMTLVYFRFVPKDALAMILTPAAFIFKVPALVPLSLGLIRGPLSALTAVFGVVSWKFIESMPKAIEPLLADKDASMLDIIQAIPKALLSAEMLLTVITFVVTMLVVTSIRKLISGRSWELATIVGSVIYMGLTIAGGIILGIPVDYLTVCVGTVVSLALCLLLEFFYYNVDYKKSEYLQFEDDQNYYYVRVMPKKKPVYSDVDEDLTESPDDEGIPMDDSRFRQMDENSEVEKKFEGINLQSKLEESLNQLNTNQTGRENSGDTQTITLPRMNPDLEKAAEDEEYDETAKTKQIGTLNLDLSGALANSLADSLADDREIEDPDEDNFDEAGSTKRL